AGGAGASGVGGGTCQGDELAGDVRAAQGATWGQACLPGGGAPAAADRALLAEYRPAVPGGGAGLLPSARQGTGQGPTAVTAAAFRISGDGDGRGPSSVGKTPKSWGVQGRLFRRR